MTETVISNTEWTLIATGPVTGNATNTGIPSICYAQKAEQPPAAMTSITLPDPTQKIIYKSGETRSNTAVIDGLNLYGRAMGPIAGKCEFIPNP